MKCSNEGAGGRCFVLNGAHRGKHRIDGVKGCRVEGAGKAKSGMPSTHSWGSRAMPLAILTRTKSLGWDRLLGRGPRRLVPIQTAEWEGECG